MTTQSEAVLCMRDGEGNTYAIPSSELGKYKVPTERTRKSDGEDDVSGHWWGPGEGWWGGWQGWGYNWNQWNNWNQWSQPGGYQWNGYQWVWVP